MAFDAEVKPNGDEPDLLSPVLSRDGLSDPTQAFGQAVDLNQNFDMNFQMNGPSPMDAVAGPAADAAGAVAGGPGGISSGIVDNLFNRIEGDDFSSAMAKGMQGATIGVLKAAVVVGSAIATGGASLASEGTGFAMDALGGLGKGFKMGDDGAGKLEGGEGADNGMGFDLGAPSGPSVDGPNNGAANFSYMKDGPAGNGPESAFQSNNSLTQGGPMASVASRAMRPGF